MKRIPYGVCNFETIIKENYYFVDKTKYIEQIELQKTPVFLRPRRFGKSLFTEILKWYYDIKAKPRFEELFGNLYIGKNPTPRQGSYFFLSLDFSGINVGDESSIKESFDRRIISKINNFLMYYQKELDFTPKDIEDFNFNSYQDATTAIANLIYLINNKNSKLFIAIDEYDAFTNALAFKYIFDKEVDLEYYQVLNKGGFFRSFFESLKDGLKTSIDKIYTTGILPITISDMNSGFNVAEWITHDANFDNMLGITEDEMHILLDEIYSDYPDIKVSKEEVLQKLKIYANNYKFLPESESVYNTTITMHILKNIVNHKDFPEDFIDSNIKVQYNQISYIFGENTKDRDDILERLVENQAVSFKLEKKKLFDLNDYKSGKYIKDCLYYHGLITNAGFPDEYIIPNLVSYEMLLCYFEKIKGFDINDSVNKDFLMDFLKTGDLEFLVKEFFERIIKNYPGDFFKNVNESFYHGLFFHVLYNSMSKDRYEVLPEFPVTNGSVDVMFKTLPKARVRAEFEVFAEIKQVPKNATNNALQTKFEEAVEQVMKYKTGEYANFKGLAICFRGNKDYLMKIV